MSITWAAGAEQRARPHAYEQLKPTFPSEGDAAVCGHRMIRANSAVRYATKAPVSIACITCLNLLRSRTRSRSPASAWVVPATVPDEHSTVGTWTRVYIVLGNGMVVGFHAELGSFFGAWHKGILYAQWPYLLTRHQRDHVERLANLVADHYGA